MGGFILARRVSSPIKYRYSLPIWNTFPCIFQPKTGLIFAIHSAICRFNFMFIWLDHVWRSHINVIHEKSMQNWWVLLTFSAVYKHGRKLSYEATTASASMNSIHVTTLWVWFFSSFFWIKADSNWQYCGSASWTEFNLLRVYIASQMLRKLVQCKVRNFFITSVNKPCQHGNVLK